MKRVLFGAAVAALLAGSAMAQPFKTPIPADQYAAKPDPRGKHPAFTDATPAQRAQMARDVHTNIGAVETLPIWTRGYSIAGVDYSYTLVGSPPEGGAHTNVPTILIPVKLTIPDYSVDGVNPLVLDATPIMSHVIASPVFTPSVASGGRQFGEGMLRAEFPSASSPTWGTVFTPTIAPTLELTAPVGSTVVIQSKSGKLLVVMKNSKFINSAIKQAVKGIDAPGKLVIVVTYNALESFAFGYHSWTYGQKGSQALVYIYTSWLEHVNDTLGFPSPDAVTLTHEIAETIHDPLITSTTLEWGDPFGHNRCFDNIIEVGDAVEFAPKRVQFYSEPGTINGKFYNFQVQNEATLQWFTRESPSSAAGGAYSFPSATALTSPAPLTCTK